MQITLEDPPSPELHRQLFAEIDAFNDAATGLTDPSIPLALVLREPDRTAEGGLLGVSYYNWLIVTHLFVPERLRGHRMGSLLMRLAESEAVARRCHGIWLETYSFEARPFYERQGFRAFGELPDYPPGHTRHFMVKTGLRRYPAAPGVAAARRIEPEDQAIIQRELRANTRALIGDAHPPGEPFALAVRDAAGAVQGGLWARTGRGWMFIELLVLPAALRRQGLGRRLLAMAEAEAVRRGCGQAWLDSFSFQAPGFYERNGWREFARLEDYPPGHYRHFLTKRLDAPPAPGE